LLTHLCFVADDIDKNDIDVIFDVKKVTVNVKNEQLISFNCLERIIPDGSFWIFGIKSLTHLFTNLLIHSCD
jgi:hypothetical protein